MSDYGFRVRVEFDVFTTNPSHIDAAAEAAEWLQARADEGTLDDMVYLTASHVDLRDGNGTQFVETDLDELARDFDAQGSVTEPAGPRPGDYLVSQNIRRRPGSAIDDRYTNTILDLFRDCWDSGDPWGSALTAMGALEDYEPGDYVDRQLAEEGVIDSRLAMLADAWEELLGHDYVEELDDACANLRVSTDRWNEWNNHAYRVMNRLADMAKLNGRDY